MTAYVAHCRTVLKSCVECPHVTTLLTSLDCLVDYMALDFPQTRDKTLRARELAFSLVNIYIGMYFLFFAQVPVEFLKLPADSEAKLYSAYHVEL